MKLPVLASIIILVLVTAGSARCQNSLPVSVADSEEDQLAHEVDDPTAILAQFKFQDIYTPGNYETSAQTNQVQLRAVVPLQPFSLFPFQQLIRPTLNVQALATSSHSSTINELTDTQLFDLFVSNWPDPAETGFGWAVGPTFVFPTGRVPKAGKHAWQVGPAVGVSYRGIPHLMLGFLFQNPISFAYTNSSATHQSQMQFQPLISYTLGHGWYIKSADSTWTVNWPHRTSTTIPISLGFGKVWEFDRVQLNPWVAGEWTSYRQYAGITPMYSARFGLTLLFPQFQL
jgi:hypothetical protein